MREFIKEILKKYFNDDYQIIYNNSDLLKYINLKTGAINGNSKSRKSLGNIYAIYSILILYEKEFFNKAEAYKQFAGYDFTLLLNCCRKLYGGEKMQNHSLNSRLNLEFDNKSASKENKGKFLIIQNKGKYLIHIDYLYSKNKDISKAILEIIEKYIDLLKFKDAQLIEKLELLSNESEIEVLKTEIYSLLNDDSEARVFEIISFAILKNYYKNTRIYFGTSKDDLSEEVLTLYKTGRTNANDGGIDFVMRPLGRFFQVSEVGSYNKYFLDIDKVLHFPITFVIKTRKDNSQIREDFNKYIELKSGGMITLINKYNDAIEEILTINELETYFNSLSNSDVFNVIEDIKQYYKIEMNFGDI